MNAERNLDTLRFLHQAHAEQLLTSEEFSQYKQAVLAGCRDSFAASSAPSAPLAPAPGNVLLAQAELLRSVSDAVQRYYQTIAPENATPAWRSSPSSTEQSASPFFAEPCSDSSCVRTIRRPNEDPLNRTMNRQLDPLQIDVSRLFRPQAPTEALPAQTAPAASRRRGVTTHDRAPALAMAAALCAVEEDLSPD